MFNYILGIILILIFIKFYFNKKDLFQNTECVKPTKNNSFMNFLVNDLIENPNRRHACKNVDSLIKKSFRATIHSDSFDIWGKFINDRNYYTMPNTEIINKQTELGILCLGNSGECKMTGNNCLKIRDPQYHRARINNYNN